MRILQVIPSLGSGGAEKFVVDLSNELAKQGHDVTLVTLFDVTESCMLEQFVDRTLIKRVCLHKKTGLDLKCYISLLRAIQQFNPDVVHAHVGAIKYIAYSVICYRKCKYYCTIHSEAKREAGRNIELWSRKFLFNQKLATAVTISEESHNSFVSFYGYSTPMIMNGCSAYQDDDFKSTHHNDVDFLFVHAGRLQRVKNQVMLVRVFSRLIDEGYRVRLLIMGRKEQSDVYDEISKYFSNNIVYLGEISNCRDYMNIADGFCLTSTMEGMPITIIEAMSVGCIPIVTPVGGCVNMISEKKNGFISKDVSEAGYYNSIVNMITTSQKELNRIKQNCINSYETIYSISTSAKKYIELFNKN